MSEQSLAGQVIANQFKLVCLLGRGGMGEVYLAEQFEMGRRVVIKLLNSEQLSKPELEERFKREARVLAQLNHPNVVQVYMFGRTEGGRSYLAMEFVQGQTLSSLLVRGALPERRALHLLEQICKALVEAHRIGVVHRDLKPDNVMLCERHGERDVVKVLDFGIAKLLREPDTKLTQSGAIFGTPQYLSPEQVKAKPADERTDIYALGLIGYELLSGEAPFRADNTMDLLIKVLSEEPLPPTRKVRGLAVSSRTEAVILRCLAKEPSARFQSAKELGEVLRELASGPQQAALPQPRAAEHDSLRPLALPTSRVAPASAHSRRVWFGSVLAALGSLILLSSWGAFDYLPLWFMPAGLPVASDYGNIPLPRDTQVVTATEQWVNLRSSVTLEEALTFYRYQFGKRWGAPEEFQSGLQFKHPYAEITQVFVAAYGGRTQITLMRNTRRR